MKTKEQILQQVFVGQEADIHLNIPSGYKFGHYPDSVQRTYIYASMQFFADQEKQALKEKIIKDVKYIRNRTFKQDGMPVGENEDFVRACDEFLAIVNAETLK